MTDTGGARETSGMGLPSPYLPIVDPSLSHTPTPAVVCIPTLNVCHSEIVLMILTHQTDVTFV